MGDSIFLCIWFLAACIGFFTGIIFGAKGQHKAEKKRKKDEKKQKPKEIKRPEEEVVQDKNPGRKRENVIFKRLGEKNPESYQQYIGYMDGIDTASVIQDNMHSVDEAYNVRKYRTDENA